MKNNTIKDNFYLILEILILSAFLYLITYGGLVDYSTDSQSFYVSEHGGNVVNTSYKDIPEVEEVKTLEEIEWLTFEGTGYVSDCDGCTGFTYYTGYDVRNTIHTPKGYRVIAVDPNVIEFGSLVEIKYDDKQFLAKAMDIGSAIQNNDVDILFATERKANNFGRREIELRIVRWGEEKKESES